MKKLFLLPLIIFSLFLIFFIFGSTPFFLNFVKGKVESAVQKETGVPLFIGSLKGNIFYTLEAAELDVGAAIHLNRLAVSYNIFGLISRQINIQSLLLDGLDVDMNRVGELSKALEKPKKEEPTKKTPFKVRIKKLSIINTKLVGAVNDKKIDLSLNLHGQVTNDVVTIDTLSLTTESSHIAFQGTVPLDKDGEIDVRYRADLLLQEFGIENLDGSLKSNGLLQGKTSSPKISNKIEFSFKYQDKILFGSSEISWQLPLLDSLNFFANIVAKTPPLQKNNSQKDVWEVFLSLQKTKLSCDISSNYGNVRLAGSLTGNFDNPQLIADLRGKFRYADFKPEARGKIAFKNMILGIKNFKISSNKLNLLGSVYLNLVTPQKIDGDILIDCENIDFLNNFLKSPQPFKGRLKIASKVKGAIQNPFMKSTIELTDITAFSEEIKNAEFILTLKDSILNLKSGVIQSTRGTIILDAWYGIADSMFNAQISSEELRLKSPEILGDDTIPISGAIGIDANFQGHVTNPQGYGTIFFKDLTYDTILFDTYELVFALKDTTLDLSLSNDIKSINLTAETELYEPFKFNASLRLNHFNFKDYIHADTGYVTANVSTRGEAYHPEKIAGEIQIESLYIFRDQNGIHNLDTIIITITDGIADIITCAFDVQGQRIEVQGNVPLNIKQGEIDLLCKTARIDLAALTALIPGTPELRGFLFLDVTAHGKIQNPDFDGKIRLEQIRYVMPDLTIDSVYSLVTFQKNNVTIEHLKGKINKGHLNISGFARIGATAIDTMSLDILLEKIDVRSKDFGLIDVSSALQVSARKDSVKIGGEVTINKALYNVPFSLQTIVELLTKANRPPSEQGEIAKRIYCDIGISAPHGVQIVNNVADVLVDVDVQIKGYLSKLNVYGTIMTPRKGTINYLGKKFDIISAVIQFDDPYKINPVLNLEASSFVSSVDGDYEIFLYVNGTVEKWRLELSSSPPVPEQDIISLLLIGRRRPGTYLLSEAKGIDLKGAAKEYTISLVKGTVEQTAERTLGLEKVEITGDILDPKQLDIGIEKRIDKRFTLIYGTGIESWEFHRIGLNYDITDNVSIYTLHDQENLNSSVDLDIHFKLK